MNDLRIWNYNNSAEVRTVMIDNEPWFVLVDVCKILEIARGSKVAERLEEVRRQREHTHHRRRLHLDI